jgi:dephospho-CoA kinase
MVFSENNGTNNSVLDTSNDRPLARYLILGLTGPPGSGKGTVADFLAELVQSRGINVQRYSLSDEIRFELKKRGKVVDRNNLRELANAFRSRLGSGVWATLTASRIEDDLAMQSSQNMLIIVDGIRNPGEVYEFRNRFGYHFKLLGLTASPERLSEYMQQRSRADEPDQVLKDKQKLRRLIQSELGTVDRQHHGHNISRCLTMTDWPIIENNGSLSELKQTIRDIANQDIIPWFADV